MTKKENDFARDGENVDESAPQFDINTDENLSGFTHLNESIEEEAESERLKSELDEQKDKYLRLAAEFDNFKRRNAKERIELIQTAGKDIIYELLEILDDVDRARQQMESADEKNISADGVNLIFNKLKNTLQARGLKEMNAIGSDFDPDKHEAIAEIPAPDSKSVGKVIDEVTKGYLLNDKLIRHAKVVVGK